ncbi:MAG: hypothetical protein KBD16_01380 [Candidatus Pacebacteria bacterium]|nr:hypothetical protein [Candidatus Paceibacterota bacterium]
MQGFRFVYETLTFSIKSVIILAELVDDHAVVPEEVLSDKALKEGDIMNRRIWILVIVVALLGLLGPLALAAFAEKPSFSVEVLPLGVPGDQVMITPDMFWKLGADFSLYSFIEYSGEDGVWFQNNIVNYTSTKHVGLRAELGVMDDGTSFFKVGPAFSTRMPGFTKVTLVPMFVSGTPGFDRELLVTWKSKSLRALGGEIWTEGFIRTLRNQGANTYGQPQVWWSRTGSAWSFGLESEVSGASQTVRVGVKRVLF